MGWSTRELAELAGTSLRAVRHYHEVGLLDEPARGTNGYKQYGPSHLVALVKIRRLVDLGFSLTQIAGLERGDERSDAAVRALDAQLAESIERLQQARLELSVLLDGEVTDPALPPALRPLDGHPLSDADRAYLVVLSRVVSADALASYIAAARAAYANPAFAAFTELHADADEQVCATLARKLLPHTLEMHAAYPGIDTLTDGAGLGPVQAAKTLATTLLEVYNPAQLDVLQRLESLRVS